MFLRYKVRRKDGKEHRYWSIVENRRVSGGRTVQRQVLYLGEINDGQKAAWCRTIETFDVAGKDNLYRCLDKLLAHKQELFSFLRQRWQTLFQADFEILLYDLTSTYFACDPPETGKRRFGHSRDHRSDCVQVVIALIVTPEGFPLTYEVMPRNTSDKTTLGDFLRRIEVPYGEAGRTWVMDRGIPTEAVLTEMRG